MERRDVMKAMAGGGALWMMACADAGGQVSGGGSGDETVYELRVYHLNEGKLPLILERFRTKEVGIFHRLGMKSVAYWTPTEEPLAGRTLVYMLRHRSRAAATESWARFKVDPEWVALKAESERGGEFVNKHESTFLALTDFSPKV